MLRVTPGSHRLEEYPHVRQMLPADEACKLESETSSKRKAQSKCANQLVMNLFHENRRYYLVIANCAFDKQPKDCKSEDGVRMFYLLDHQLKVVSTHRAEHQQAT